MMNYVISFKAIRLRKIQPTLIDFDLYLNFDNKADVGFTIESQVYDVYLNGIFVSKVVNNTAVPILKKAVSIIPLKVQVNPETILKKVLKNPLELITNYDKIKLKVVVKMKVKLWFFRVNIPYTYEATLKEIMASDTK